MRQMNKERTLTAGYLEGAGLPVHGIQLQVHRTGQGQGYPASSKFSKIKAEYVEILFML